MQGDPCSTIEQKEARRHEKCPKPQTKDNQTNNKKPKHPETKTNVRGERKGTGIDTRGL